MDTTMKGVEELGIQTETEEEISSEYESEKEAEESSESENESESESGNESAAELSWKELSVISPDGRTILLKDAIGSVKGRFLAIMGPSGAGKTSMMNVLACRLQKSKAKGKKVLDGFSYNRGVLKRMAGYVMQDDLLFPDLTVRETLRYAAFLRMPADVPRKEKKQRVKEVIRMLGLEKCADTKVGNSLKKGISGGERKRLCVGIELLLKPRLLFLDEPTSGLDGVTALTLCRILRDLAHQEENNCTVICTIHQPATQIFHLFDDLMILKGGYIIYHGPAHSVLNFYDQAGFPCPPHTNPADHILDVITPSAFTLEEMQKADENAVRLRESWKPDPPDFPAKIKKGGKHFKKTSPRRISWFSQVWYLLGRSYKNIYRDRFVLFVEFLQSVIWGVLIGTVFLQMGTSQASLPKRNSLHFFMCANQGLFAATMLVTAFPSERLIVLRERQGGTYYASAYYFSKIFAEMSVQLIFPFIFSCIMYWLVGFQKDAGKFFIFAVLIELVYLAAVSYGFLISTLCRTVTKSVTLLPLVFETCRLFGGGYLSPANLPDYFAWLDALSFIKYGYVGTSLNEYTGLEFYCKPNEYRSDGTCPVTNGQQVIDSLGLDYITIWGCVLALIGLIVAAQTLAYIAFRFLKG